MYFEMGALNTPEAGDALKTGASKDRKDFQICKKDRTSKFSWSMLNSDKKHRTSSATSTSSVDIVNEELYNRIALGKNGVSHDAINTVVRFENCEFPYYRSNGRFPDAVLVKDVGVSCALLNGNSDDRKPSTSGIESYLVKQLKAEYNELSNITRKITEYTKDIMIHLLQRTQRNQKIIQKHLVNDRSSSTTKLTTCNDIEVQCSINPNSSHSNLLPQRVYVTPRICNNNARRKNNIEDQAQLQSDDLKLQNRDVVENTFIQDRNKIRINSFAYNGTSVYDYLMMERRISCDKILKKVPRKLSNRENHRRTEKEYDGNNHEDCLKKGDSLMFTNWREISKTVASRDRSVRPIETFNELRPTKNTELLYRDRGILWPPWEKSFIGRRARTDLHDTNFHTINIRIVKQKRKRP